MFEITKGKQEGAEKVVIYGPEGIGKSTFASKFPDPIFIDTEGSTRKMDVRRMPKPTSWEMLQNEVREIIANRLCATIVIDTIDWAEQLCIRSLCDRFEKKGIEEFGYGKGYVYEQEDFGKLLNLLQEAVDSGINVVLTAHAQLRKFEQPDEMGAYDRWELKLGKKTGSTISPLVKEWADMVLFCNYKTVTVAADDSGKKFKAAGGERVMFTSHHPCWDAKNRDGLAPELPFDFGQIAWLFNKGGKPTDKPTVKPKPAESKVATPMETPSQAAAQPVQSLPDEQPVNIPDGIPRELADLMRANNVDEASIRFVVAQKGYFPESTPLADYPEDFVRGCLIGAWEQVYKEVTDLCGVPF